MLLFLMALAACQSSDQEGKSKNTLGDQAANTADSEKIYVNDDLEESNKARATYYLVKEYVEPYTLVKPVPTYDQGMRVTTQETPLDLYLFNYYFKDNDQLAFSVQTFVRKEDPEKYQFQGAAVWYHEDGSLKAKGSFDLGKLTGPYIEYDENGEEKATKRFLAGKEVDVEANVYEPLVGRWVHIARGEDTDREIHLYNEFKDDGTLLIHTERFYKFNDKKTPTYESDPELFIWKYDGDTKELEVYQQDGGLQGKTKIDFKDKKTLSSTITRHQNPSLVGEKYQFRKLE